MSNNKSIKTLSAIVEKGSRKGTELGFPTTNIPLNDASLSGIYAGQVFFDGKNYLSALFADQKRNLLEAHILGFDGDLYGKKIVVTVFGKVRDSKDFDSASALRKAINDDIVSVRDYFKKNTS